jgi:peptidoglycan/LPS O-acetylase OafA/YrhL
MAEAAKRRFVALDELRGVAVVLVLLFHSTYFGNLPAMIPIDPAQRPWIVALMSGWIGVDLFFVLSGFLITSILLEARGEQHYYRSFYLRRVLRIVPAYYAALLIAFTVLRSLLALRRAPAGAFAYLATYLSNIPIALRGWDAIPLSMQHFWSLAIEEHFYLFWPLVVARLDPRRGIYVCASMIAFSLCLRVVCVSLGLSLAAYVLTPARLDGLAAGGLLAYQRHQGRMPSERTLATIAAIAIAGIAAIVAQTGWFYYEEPLWAPSAGITCVSALAFVLVALALRVRGESGASSLLGRLFETFGRYSYGLYVWHQPAIVALLRLHWLAPPVQSAPGFGARALAWYGAVFALAWLLALLSYHVIERPCLRLKDRIAPTRAAVPAS